MTTLEDSIRQAIEAYLARSQLSERKLSAFAVGDPTLIPRFRASGSMRLDTADQLLTYMDEEPIGPTFRSEVEAFLSETGIAERKFGGKAAGDPAFVTRLRSGATPRLSTVQRVQGWMRAHKDELIRAAAARKQAELRATSDVSLFGPGREGHARRLDAAVAFRRRARARENNSRRRQFEDVLYDERGCGPARALAPHSRPLS